MTNAIVVQEGRFIAPVADVQTALRRYQAVKDFIGSVLVENVDFGKVPGSDKPVLLKPGAEKMTAFFGFNVRFILSDFVEDWTGKDHNGEPFFYYRYRAQLWRDDQLIAEGDGSCNSWEKKYRYRQAERICPSCGKPTIIAGKKEYGGGWLCFVKKGGCGLKFAENDPKITEQKLGQTKNADPADIVNTLQKMAQKRALVAPVLIATNTSDYFTQDIDDFIDATATEVVPVLVPSNNGHEPDPEHPAIPEPVMEAMERKGRDGRKYGDLTDDELNTKINDLLNRLDAINDPDKRKPIEVAIKQCETILEYRNTAGITA